MASAAPLSWPADTGFAKRKIGLGEIKACHVSSALEKIWSKKGAAFYKPLHIPPAYFILGHHCQTNTTFLQGSVIAVKAINGSSSSPPPLEKPVDYALVWSSKSGKGKKGENGFFWRPVAPQGYKALGYLLTKVADKPSLDEIRCVRSDLTGVCKNDGAIWTDKKDGASIQILSAMPDPEKQANGVFAGTFFCSIKNESSELEVGCLVNTNSVLTGMPSLEEVHSVIGKYGPTVYFHPKETYLPSSVPWFFKNGALLYSKKDSSTPLGIAEDGSNLPQGGSADGEYWIDVPKDSGKAKMVRRGDLESAEAYVHVKSVMGGTFTDVAMWVFYPFNGPATLVLLKALSVALGRIGEHVGDWEHVTLRINNFTGELWGIYLSQHSGGRWVKAGDLEYMEQGKRRAVVYSSRNGHACFSKAGLVVQGSRKLGVGIANSSAKSAHFLDTSTRYKIVGAEYLKEMDGSESGNEPAWLNYARKWGPKIKYAASGLSGWIKLPSEISGQDGPTGPKWKSSWFGDEKVKDVF